MTEQSSQSSMSPMEPAVKAAASQLIFFPVAHWVASWDAPGDISCEIWIASFTCCSCALQRETPTVCMMFILARSMTIGGMSSNFSSFTKWHSCFVMSVVIP